MLIPSATNIVVEKRYLRFIYLILYNVGKENHGKFWLYDFLRIIVN